MTEGWDEPLMERREGGGGLLLLFLLFFLLEDLLEERDALDEEEWSTSLRATLRTPEGVL